MGKFKSFILGETVGIGLGDLGPNIDKLLNSRQLDRQIGGALTSSQWTGSQQPSNPKYPNQNMQSPNTDLSIPSVERSGRITHLELKKNPIYVRLSDGTECHFSYDEYRRIHGDPAIGKVMTISFQRHPEDWTQQHSKIEKAIVRD